MRTVVLAPSWRDRSTFRQLPSSSGGVWGGTRFTQDRLDRCDYLVVLNHPTEDLSIRCSPERVWSLVMEPPNEYYKELHIGDAVYSRIFTTDADLIGERYIHTHPALGWSLNMGYDDLLNLEPVEKSLGLSWITSNKVIFLGHRKRMAFLRNIVGKLDFHLYGRGFCTIDDKLSALAPYKYSIAFENFVNPFYWSEKLADCYLAWTMPIYYGCTRIEEYFPPESMIRIDVNDANVVDQIREAVLSDRWRRNRDAVAHARELVLNKYQLFPFLVRQIRDFERAGGAQPSPERVVRVSSKPRLPLTTRVRRKWIELRCHLPLR